MRNEVNIWDLACVVSSVQSAPNVNPNPIPLVGSCGLEKDKDQRTNNTIISQVELLWILDRLFPKMGECREVLGGGPAPPSKL